MKAPFFRRVETFVHNLTRKLNLFFHDDELHIILKSMNLEMGYHSSFFQLVNKNILNFVNN